MPYINPNRRAHFDVEIDSLCDVMRQVGAVKGDVNYTVCRIVLNVLKPYNGWNYSSLSEAIGALHDAETELRRRLLDPYENDAIRKNGDVPEILDEGFRLIP